MTNYREGGAKDAEIKHFAHGKSSSAVTTRVEVGRTGNMTVIDTPGTNDPSKQRPNKQIEREMINTIRKLLIDKF